MNKPATILAVLSHLLIACFYSSAQTVDWATVHGSDTTSERGEVVATNPDGDVYVIGFYDGTSISLGSDTLPAALSTAFFLSKFDSTGILHWSRTYPGVPWGTTAKDLVIDESGDLYLTGWFQGSMNFGDTTISAFPGTSQGYLAKLNPDGDVLWARHTTSTNNLGLVQSHQVALYEDKVYMSGLWIFNFLLDSVQDSNADTVTNWFLASYDRDGNFRWMESAQGIDSTDFYPEALVAGPDGVYFGGFFMGPLVFGTDTVVSSGSAFNTNGLITQYNHEGEFQWRRIFGGNSYNRVYDLAMDGTNHLYFVGSHDATPQVFGIPLNGFGHNDGLVGKLDALGNAIWVKEFGGANNDLATAIEVSALGDVYVGGIIGDAAFDQTNVTTHGWRDGFISKFDTDGQFVWVELFGGTSSGGTVEHIAQAGEGVLYATGGISDTLIYFGSNVIGHANPPKDLYLVRLWDDHPAILNVVSFAGPRDLSVYPNPTSDWLQIVGDEIIKEAHVTDLAGRQWSVAITDNDGSFYVGDLPAGLYLLQVRTDDENYTCRFTKTN